MAQQQTELQVEQYDNKLVLSKQFAASKEQVFAMFSDPVRLAQWWGPTDWPASIKTFDFTPGGVWHYYMTGPDGTKAWGKATFQTIDAPNSLSFSDAFSDEQGTVDPTLPIGASIVTFTDQDGGTLLRMEGTYESPEAVAKLVEMGMVEGCKDTWGQLERLLATDTSR